MSRQSDQLRDKWGAVLANADLPVKERKKAASELFDQQSNASLLTVLQYVDCLQEPQLSKHIFGLFKKVSKSSEAFCLNVLSGVVPLQFYDAFNAGFRSGLSARTHFKGNAALVLGRLAIKKTDVLPTLEELLRMQDAEDNEAWVSQCAAQAIADRRKAYRDETSQSITDAIDELWSGERAVERSEQLFSCLFVALRNVCDPRSLKWLLQHLSESKNEFIWDLDSHDALTLIVENLIPEGAAPAELLEDLDKIESLCQRSNFPVGICIELLALLAYQNKAAVLALNRVFLDDKVAESFKLEGVESLIYPLTEEYREAELLLLLKLIQANENTCQFINSTQLSRVLDSYADFMEACGPERREEFAATLEQTLAAMKLASEHGTFEIIRHSVHGQKFNQWLKNNRLRFGQLRTKFPEFADRLSELN